MTKLTMAMMVMVAMMEKQVIFAIATTTTTKQTSTPVAVTVAARLPPERTERCTWPRTKIARNSPTSGLTLPLQLPDCPIHFFTQNCLPSLRCRLCLQILLPVRRLLRVAPTAARVL